jgi:hypothetical protein
MRRLLAIFLFGLGILGQPSAADPVLGAAGAKEAQLPLQPVSHLHRVNIVGPVDQRAEMSKKRGELEAAGFRGEDFEQAMACNVLVYCPKNSSDLRSWGSGFDAGVEGQISTAAHVLYNSTQYFDESRGTIETFHKRSSFAGCYAKNYAYPDDRIPLQISQQQAQNLLINPAANKHRDDWAVLKLERPLQGCHPYTTIGVRTPPLHRDDILINLSFPQDGMKNVTGKEPVAQVCHVKDVFGQEGAGPTPIGTDCDASGAGSGGVLLEWVPDPNDPDGRGGRFRARGMVVMSGNKRINYKEYNLTTNDARKFSGTLALAVNNDFLKAMVAGAATQGSDAQP